MEVIREMHPLDELEQHQIHLNNLQIALLVEDNLDRQRDLQVLVDRVLENIRIVKQRLEDQRRRDAAERSNRRSNSLQ